MLNFGCATPKRHIIAQNRVFWRIFRRCPWWRLGCKLEVISITQK